MTRLVAVTDSVFPNLDPAKEVLSKIGAEVRLAAAPTAESIMEVARDADAVLTTYAKVTGGMIPQLSRCRIIGRFGIGVDNVDLPAATHAGIVVSRVPDYCLDEVSDHAMALLLALCERSHRRMPGHAIRPLENACCGPDSSPARNHARQSLSGKSRSWWRPRRRPSAFGL